ncbi:response regulator [bacterium]|nr:response regulator [bacterium]
MKKPVIVVVEDNPQTRKMLRVTLESGGYSVFETATAKAALDAIGHSRPDAVLQDLILPDMDGFELAQRIRALPWGPDLPIFALSGFVGRMGETRANAFGFAALLLKPIEPDRLLAVLQERVPTRERTAPAFGKNRRMLLVDDDPIQLKVTRLQFADLGFEVVVANSAATALRAAREKPPDIIVSDVFMPNMDGFQFCLAIRRDEVLKGIPVVLLSAWYESESDRELARRVGATMLAARTPDLDIATRAIREALAAGASAAVPADEGDDRLKLDHAQTVIAHLERRLETLSGLARRCTLQAAQIALLSGITDALTSNLNTDLALRDVLAATLDAAGISKGALFFREDDGPVKLRLGIGFSERELDGLDRIVARPDLLAVVFDRRATLSLSLKDEDERNAAILKAAGVDSIQLVPLVSESRCVGIILLGAITTDVSNEDTVAFARAMGNQLALSLELAHSFQRLAESERKYRTVMTNAHDFVAILSPDGTIREANRRAAELLGCEPDDLVGRPLAKFIDPNAGDPATIAESILRGPAPSIPIPIRRHDGSVVLKEFSRSELEFEGAPMMLVVGRDVTERVHAQAQLMVADRMASLGTLAAGVAHEINNPLSAVTGNLDLAASRLARVSALVPNNADLTEIASEIRDALGASERVARIVDDIRMFSRVQDVTRDIFDIHRVVDSSLRIAQNEIRHRARVVTEYGDVPRVQANESQVGQVILNLILNAAQAIPEGAAAENEIRVRTRASDGRKRIVLEVSDTGAGIAPHHAAQLFTPFFTTKPAGVGTGLGLAICHRIVTALGGEITFESAPGRGTTFRVTLPAADETAARDAPASPAPNGPPRRGRILVVDDDPMVTTIMARVLTAEHEVVSLTDAAEAMKRIAAGERFDVIVCDMMMPRMSGMDFHAELRRQAPEQADRMVFITGGAYTAKARKFLETVPNARLDKPFRPQVLREIVNERLR